MMDYNTLLKKLDDEYTLAMSRQKGGNHPSGYMKGIQKALDIISEEYKKDIQVYREREHKIKVYKWISAILAAFSIVFIFALVKR